MLLFGCNSLRSKLYYGQLCVLDDLCSCLTRQLLTSVLTGSLRHVDNFLHCTRFRHEEVLDGC